MKTDIIVDLQYGDCAKGKVTHHLLKEGGYTHVLRYNGGGNAGHTIYHEGKQFVTHYIPAGVFFGVKSVIGPGCVVHAGRFLKEMKELEEGGLSVKGHLFIASNTHIATDAHIEEEGGESAIGTTKTGNGPAYRDKSARVGIRAEDVLELEPYLIDWYKELHENENEVNVLCEGAQGFGLDIDWGDYPYVTSSHPTVAGALLNAIPAQAIRDIWGVAKIYETYVGAKDFEPREEVFQQIRDAGEEYGATTGRPRQCSWLNWNTLEKAVRVNGVSHLVFSKMDILRQVGVWKVIDGDEVIDLETEENTKNWLVERLIPLGLSKENIHFSERKDAI